jgi:hypothetical protein
MLKRIYWFPLFTIVILGACSKNYVQLYKTKSMNIANNDRSFKFQNDSIEINYSFWADKGIMSFSVTNKLSIPIYIDWKKSNFISNNDKFNYWDDEERSKGINVRKQFNSGYLYSGPLLIPYLSIYENVSSGIIYSSSNTVKPERLTFLPPKSIIYKSPYHLTTINYPDKINFETKKEKRLDKSRKSTTVYLKSFTKENSPLIFRNFLTFSFSEDFKNEFYIDNEFFVGEIEFIDTRHFEGTIFVKGKSKFINKYQRGIDFYRR